MARKPKYPTNPAPKKERKRSADDWAPAFLLRLAVSGNITDACDHVQKNRTTFYDRRNSDAAFAEAAKGALSKATASLEVEAMRRARDGVVRPVMHDGKPVFVWVDATGAYVKPRTKGAKQVALMEHEYSDTLMIFLLKAHKPKKYRDRQHIEHTGKNGGPMEYRNLTDAEINQRIAAAQQRLRDKGRASRDHAAGGGTSQPAPGARAS